MRKELKDHLINYNRIARYEGSAPFIQEVYNDIDHLYLYQNNEIDEDDIDDIDNYALLISSRRERTKDYIIFPDTDYLNIEFPDNRLIANVVEYYIGVKQ